MNLLTFFASVKMAIMSQRRSMNQKCSHKVNHEKNLNKM